MSTQISDYQGAKRSRGGTTASIRNAERRLFGYSPFGQARNRAPGVVAATLRGTATRRRPRLARRPITGLCEAPFSVNRP
ncbi:hypothetical protein D3C72_1369810 [compost metagenome]